MRSTVVEMSLQAILFDRDGTLFDTRVRDVLGYLYKRYLFSLEKFNLRLLPRVKYVIDQLSSLGLEMAMISSGTGTKATANILRTLGLERFFKSVLTLDDYGLPTPLIAIRQFLFPKFKERFKAWQISESLKRLNILPHKALVVGDSIFDVLAGKIIGTKTALITAHLKNQRLLETIRPDVIINSVLQLPEAIEAILTRK